MTRARAEAARSSRIVMVASCKRNRPAVASGQQTALWAFAAQQPAASGTGVSQRAADGSRKG